MKTILILCASLAFAPLLPAATNLSSRIKSKYEWTFWRLLSPHGGQRSVLIVDGKRFEDVRGGKSFYLPVPKTNAIIFVTEEKTPKYYMTFHFYSLDTKRDLKVSLGTGGPRPGDTGSRVFSFTGTNICVSAGGIESEGVRTETRYNINLSQQRFVSEERLYFDRIGTVTNHDVFLEPR